MRIAEQIRVHNCLEIDLISSNSYFKSVKLYVLYDANYLSLAVRDNILLDAVADKYVFYIIFF